jgi:BlaI family transcriptional regulator, penicillinase repressor
MASNPMSPSPRHSILDLAPLELDCMNALWPLGEATVRQVQDTLRPTRPRAYTTIMTILDRLSHKGIVERRKVRRAWVYRASVSAEQARAHAVTQVVDGFFGGSTGALASHISTRSSARGAAAETKPVTVAVPPSEIIPIAERPKQRRAENGTIASAKTGDASEPANLDASLL